MESRARDGRDVCDLRLEEVEGLWEQSLLEGGVAGHR